MAARVFWSYVHDDNDAEGGRILDLAHDVAAQYGALTAEKIDIFVDRLQINWGDDWEFRIEEALMSTAFFVPVVSPRYLASESCRKELRVFAFAARQLGAESLILPIVWFPTPQLDDLEPNDELVDLIKRFQWEPWTETRFESRDSPTYRRHVYALANRLAETASQSALSPPSVANLVSAPYGSGGAALTGYQDRDVEEDAGVVDLLADFEDVMPKWTQNVEETNGIILEITQLAEQANRDLESGEQSTKPMAARLTALRKFALALTPKAQRIEELGNEFAAYLFRADGGVRAVLASAVETVAKDPNGELSTKAKEYAQAVTAMAESSRVGLGGLRSMVTAAEPIEALSRDLRAPLRTLRRGLTLMVEGQQVIDRWALEAQVIVDHRGPDAT